MRRSLNRNETVKTIRTFIRIAEHKKKTRFGLKNILIPLENVITQGI